MKEFTTAIERVEGEEEDEEQPIEFAIDGFECKAYRPGDGQIAMLMVSQAKHSNAGEKIAGIINFFASVLDDDAQAYISNRLFDRNDDYGLEQVEEVVSYLIGEWSGRPTKQRSGSTQSPKRTGRKSTAAVPAST